jgi:glycine C-acetyltransferase
MLGDAKLAQEMAARLLKAGIYVIGFFYPVVPKGEARIRVQVSAVHTREELAAAITEFTKIRDELAAEGIG